MTEDEGRKPDAENGDDGDYALGMLVRLANSGGLSMGVTLFVGGTMISGLLVGVGEYHEGLAKMLDEAGENAEWLAELHRLQAKEVREQIGTDMEAAFNAPYRLSFIHLQDAKVWAPGGDPLPTGRGFWWRGRMDRVDGFSVGNLGPPGTPGTPLQPAE